MHDSEHYGRKIDVSLCVSRAQYSASIEAEQESDASDDDETKPFKNTLYEDGEPEDVMNSDSEGEKSEAPSDESEEEDVDEPRDRKHVIPPDCTLFVRNLLFETTDEDLFAK